jgi:hypothetical protein
MRFFLAVFSAACEGTAASLSLGLSGRVVAGCPIDSRLRTVIIDEQIVLFADEICRGVMATAMVGAIPAVALTNRIVAFTVSCFIIAGQAQ